MRIETLELISFRNYAQRKINFSENNLIVGENGSGKTTLLEAINILAEARSVITRGLNKAVKQGQKGFILSGQFKVKQDKELKIIFRQEKNVQRVIKINENILKKSSELFGLVNSVIFLPQDIALIQGSPQTRRKYLDIVISRIDPTYYQNLQQQMQLLKQRNALLKELRDKRGSLAVLEPWDEQFAAVNARLFLTRKNFLEKVNLILQELYNKIGFAQKVELKYLSEVLADPEENRKALLKKQRIELLSGTTSFGIQRDDFLIEVNELPAAEYCSQGQQRLLAVCLKLAEARFREELLGDQPILLIDDVLLELDLKRFNALIKATLPKSQKIFTVTDTGRFDPALLKELKIIELGE